ncbi:hypothetical protein F8388_005740 [Cannabis sativa]|uniref:BHLH domain-containing protein n=1 Tax=Cannabis sativa TaxID=3483 RepID=A0A7J6HQ56_CANSA|nr:hypothetical protein F8388_005740 [Cannabis sativa]
MSPLHRSNELCFQISPNPQNKNEIFTEDQILGHASLEDNAFHVDNYKDINVTTTSRRSPKSLPNDHNSNNTIVNQSSSTECKSNKMMKHRDIERQRRQEMSTLHASLRSLLPLELIKGKRSISDHINEGARYIKQLQLKIKELDAKRDHLKKYYYLSDSSSTERTNHPGRPGSSRNSSTPQDHFLTVQPCGECGVEIVISACGFPLSKVLQLVLEEGFGLVSCISTEVNGRMFHTIKSENSNIESECMINISALEKKLNEVITADVPP